MTNQKRDCRYCDTDYQTHERNVLSNEHFIANFDNHPVSPGHMKIIPKKHRDAIDELSDQEMIALKDMIHNAKELVCEEHTPDGWNIGNNEGASAGQTIFHLHIHVIPRYAGDVADPRGGVRTILPGGNYLEK